jgi:tRNA pseudouridine55 synthase
MAGAQPVESVAPRGLVLLDKPAGWTSHDAVAWLRRRLGLRRIGHAGTLDPLATGLLPCLVGPATRLVEFLHGWPKTYVGRLGLGCETPTGDLESLPDGFEPTLPAPPTAVLRNVERRLTGTLYQQPPAYSAKKIGGVPAHRLARRGYEPRIAAVEVTVHRLRLTPAPPGRLAFAVRVSSGTYIRSLGRDVGRLVGTGAYLEHLRRTAIGPLRVAAAWPPNAPDAEEQPVPLHPPHEIPLPFPTLRLGEADTQRFRNGGRVAGCDAPAGRIRVLTASGLLAGIGEVDPTGQLAPRVVLPPE